MKFGIRKKLLGGFILVLLVFTGTSMLGLYSLQQVVDSLNKTLAYPMVVNRSCSEIEVLILSMQRSMDGIALSHNREEVELRTREIRLREKEALRLFSVLQDKILGNTGKILALDTRINFYLWRPVREKVITHALDRKYSEAQVINKTQSDAQVRTLQLGLKQIGNYATQRVKLFTEKSAVVASHAKIIGIATLALSLLLSIFISFYLSFSITGRLNLINEATTKMAKGEIKQTLEVKGHDELSQVADNFNIMAAELSGMYDNLEKKVRERTRELKETNDELNLIKNDLENKVNERTNDLEEKIHELNRSQLAMLYMIEDMNLTSRQLKETQEELIRKERLAILGQFSGNISHELRNPLGVIDSSIYYLQMRLNDRDEKIQQHLERISQGVKTSTTIIENLLNLTRLNKSVLTRYNLSSLLKECLGSCRIPEGIQVIEAFTEEEILIRAEKEQIRMAVTNLVKNAVASMNGEGTLTVKTRKTEEQEAEIRFVDTGAGIDPDNISKIFQPLFSTKAKGIGLGLSITKMIVENHNGSIEVVSESGKGASFIIRLPLFAEENSGDSGEDKTT
jgi:signal transduction histidine kinase